MHRQWLRNCLWDMPVCFFPKDTVNKRLNFLLSSFSAPVCFNMYACLFFLDSVNTLSHFHVQGLDANQRQQVIILLSNSCYDWHMAPQKWEWYLFSALPNVGGIRCCKRLWVCKSCQSGKYTKLFDSRYRRGLLPEKLLLNTTEIWLLLMLLK